MGTKDSTPEKGTCSVRTPMRLVSFKRGPGIVCTYALHQEEAQRLLRDDPDGISLLAQDWEVCWDGLRLFNVRRIDILTGDAPQGRIPLRKG